MKANELRVGNFVDFGHVGMNGWQEFAVVVGCVQNTIIIDDNRLPNYTELGGDEMKPIPLTEEWLERFGFTETNRITRVLDSEEVELIFDLADRFVIVDLGQGSQLSGIAVDCKYVHQLQNIYFTLTGKELELKEKINQ